MAKVSRLLLNEKKDKMTDEDFFMSGVMKAHFEGIIEGICKTFRRRIQVKVINEGNSVACTDGNTIKVNLNSDWISSQDSRINKYYIIVGIILHECGHILYTDLALLKDCVAALSDNRLIPRISISDGLKDSFDRGRGRKLIGVYKTLDNCIEDGHIEKRVLKYVPGYGECLMKVRRRHRDELGINSYEKRLEEADKTGKKLNRIAVMLDLILMYAKYGIDNTGEVTDDLTEAFVKMRDSIDMAVSTQNAMGRQKKINIVFDMLIDFISDEIENEHKNPEPEPGDSSSDKEKQDDSKASSEKEGGSLDNKDESDAYPESDDVDSAIGEDSSSEDDGLSMEELDKAFDEALDSISDICDEMSDKTERTDGSMKPVSDDDDLSGETPEEGSRFEFEKKDGPEEFDLSYLENEAACEELAKDVRNKIEKAMKKNADDIRKDRVDKYPSQEKYVNPDEDAVFLFMLQHEELDRIARRVVKNLDKVIRERQKGDRQNGLYTGRQLDSSHAYRKDKKIFANKILPEDIPDMEVCVLVDCSGSMSFGTRMEQSRKCAYITWKFCKIMQIPCSIYGHTTTGKPEKVLMTCVAHPESIDKDDEKRIFMLRPEANNRDGWAVNFCCEALTKSKAQSKMLLIISDGLPAASGYYGILGKRDCQEVVKKYKKKGISVVTAGIDDCAADIKELYIDGVSPKDAARFLDYSDMTQLPKAFANLIKKELL